MCIRDRRSRSHRASRTSWFSYGSFAFVGYASGRYAAPRENPPCQRETKIRCSDGVFWLVRAYYTFARHPTPRTGDSDMTSTHVLRTLSALFAAAVSSSASAATHTIDGSAYVIDGQYTAVLQQRAHRWRLVPYSGGEVDVTDTLATCGSSEAIPTGLWYVSRDAHDLSLI